MSFHKAGELLELARMVASRRLGVTLTDVQQRFGGVERTAQRMLGALQHQFPDVESKYDHEGRKRWFMDGQHLRDLLSLAAEEVAALDIAIAHLERAALPAEARSVRDLKEKILTLVPRKSLPRIETDHEALLEAQGFVARAGPRPKSDPLVQAALLDAIKACELVDIVYRSHQDERSKARRVAPYGILSGSRRYLVGRPAADVDGPIRTYRIDAIEAASPTGEGFVRPDDFDLQTFANRSFGAYHTEEEYKEIVWRFKPEAADHARGHMFHPDQTVERQSDGSILVRFRASGFLEMTWYLYSWGDKVEVVSPPELRALVDGFRRSDFPALP